MTNITDETKYIIYRPYKNIKSCAESLSVSDLSLMRINCIYLLAAIAQEMGWKNFGLNFDKEDKTFRYYYNNGKPFYRFLLEYYTEVFIKSVKTGGGEIDTCGIYEKLYTLHKDDCEHSDSWSTVRAVNHRLYLLKYDCQWYKRKFRKYRSSYLENYRFYDKQGIPISISMADLKGKIYE